MYKVNTRIRNEIALKMLDICGFSFIDATTGDKCAHLGLINCSLRKNIHLPPMEVRPC